VSPESLRAPASVIDFARTRGVEVHERESLDEVIGRSDVIYWTRVQQERFADEAEYQAIADRFVMTPSVLAAASDDAILMHPLPRKHEMGTEADHAILDADPRSVYFTRCRTHVRPHGAAGWRPRRRGVKPSWEPGATR
jgi:carbamoyl-phosphate synthase/aspartate carbamoyltransferase